MQRSPGRAKQAFMVLRDPTDEALAAAARLIDDGRLVGLPTETVYGLAADAGNPRAVAALFAAKGRPHFNPLIAHVTGRDMAAQLVDIPAAAGRLMAAFWPGPLTLVLPKRPAAAVADLATAALDTLAVRAPAHAVAQALLARTGRPLVAPSANPSGRLSPTRAQHVVDGLGDKVAMVLDGGPCAVGLESSIVFVGPDGLQLLRPGGLTAEALAEVAGQPVPAAPAQAGIRAPGQLSSHYAPAAPVRLDAVTAAPGEVLIGFGPVTGDLTLSAAGDLSEAAANLFQILRQADARADRIAVAPIPDLGLGIAINDRLRRAAAPRP